LRFNPDHYLEASQERIHTARLLHEQERYAPAIYLAGVAVECLLLAYRTRQNLAFESRHDLRSLLKESGIAAFIREKDQQRLAARLGDVWARWKNNYRFASDGRLTTEFKRLKLYGKFRGDILKPNCEIIINSAFEVINLGVRRWTSTRS